MKALEKSAMVIRCTPEEKKATELAAKLARQSTSSYNLQAVEERVKREGKEWPEAK